MIVISAGSADTASGVADSESLLSTRIDRLGHHGTQLLYTVTVLSCTVNHHVTLLVHHTIIMSAPYHTSRTPRRHLPSTSATLTTPRRHLSRTSATLTIHHQKSKTHLRDTQTHHSNTSLDSITLPSPPITLVHLIYSLLSLLT